MPISIHGFTYDEAILEAEETVKEFNKSYKEVQAEIAAEKDPKKRNALAYGNWMRSRNAGAYNHYEVVQARERHEVAHISNGHLVCTCGLITGTQGSIVDIDEIGFWNEPGHIHTATRTQVSIFVIQVYVSKDIGLQDHYWCQTCGDFGTAIPTKAGNISLVGLKAIRASHKCVQVK